MFGTTISACAVIKPIATSRLRCYLLSIRAFSCLPVYPDRVSKAVLCFASLSNKSMVTMAKRKSHTTLARESPITTIPIPVTSIDDSKRGASHPKASQANPEPVPTNPDRNPDILDGAEAKRASPDAEELDERVDVKNAGIDGEKHARKEEKDNDESDSPLSDLSDTDSPVEAEKSKSKSNPTGRVGIKSGIADSRRDVETAVQTTRIQQQPANGHQFLDPESEGDEEADEEEIQAALSRPPPVNSDYLPLPWKGRLGYVRREFSTASSADFRPGLFKYISTLFKPASLQLSNLPYCIYPRKSTPAQRSH